MMNDKSIGEIAYNTHQNSKLPSLHLNKPCNVLNLNLGKRVTITSECKKCTNTMSNGVWYFISIFLCTKFMLTQLLGVKVLKTVHFIHVHIRTASISIVV